MGIRILVVEDEDTLRHVIGRVLRRDGHEVVEAACAEEALNAFRQQPFPLVITDVLLGRMTGLQLLEEVKLLDEDAVVVIMTSHASIDMATSALRSGAYDFLLKPFEDLGVISTVVNRAAEKIRLIDDNRTLMMRLRENAEELERLNRGLKAAADRDGLTGLYNHRYFTQALDTELARSRRHGRTFSLIFLDIDHFKHYNDTHGHLAGDDLLKELAKNIQGLSRRSTVVARYGGEEFVLVVPETDKEGARRFAESIRKSAEQHPFPGRETQPLGTVSLSLGVSTFPEDGDDAKTLVDRADKALYRAKGAGRNRVECWDAAAVPQEETA